MKKVLEKLKSLPFIEKFKRIKYNKKTIVLTCIGVLLIIALIQINSYFSPSKPNINITSSSSFIGDTHTIEGKITAKCRCKVTATFDGKEIQLNEDGTFTELVNPSSKKDKSEYELTATAEGKFLNTETVISKRDIRITRKEVPLKLTSEIYSTKETSLGFTFEGEPNTQVAITPDTSYFSFKPDHQKPEELPTKEVFINEEGVASISVAFDNNERNMETTYSITGTLEGYTPYEQTLKIKNLNHDHSEWLAARSEWDEQKEIEKLINAMDSYSGNGDIMIAIGDVKTSRTVGSWYVKDPTNFQYVSLGIYVKNTGSTSTHANPGYITVIDENKRTYNYETASYEYSNYFDAVDLQPNTYTSGYLAFILPKNQHKFTVVYNNNWSTVRKEIYVK